MARRKRNYTVRTGDTAATIARQLGVDPQTLMQANTGVSNLRPGMVLKQPPQQGGGVIMPPTWNPTLDKMYKGVTGYANMAQKSLSFSQNPWAAWQNADYGIPNLGSLWQQQSDVNRQPQPTPAPFTPYNVGDIRGGWNALNTGGVPGHGGWDSGYWNWDAAQKAYRANAYTNRNIDGLINTTALGGAWTELNRDRGGGLFGGGWTSENWRSAREKLGYYPNDYSDRQAYQTADGSYVDRYGRRFSGGVDPRDLQTGRLGRGAPIPQTTFGGSAMTPTEAAAGSGALQIQQTGGGGGYMPRDVFERMYYGKGAEGRENLQWLAEEAAKNYGYFDYEAKDGSIGTMRVRNRGGGDVRFTPISGATRRAMSRPKSMAPRRARMKYGRSTHSGLTGDDRRKAQANDNTSSSAVGSAPRYQAGYNFDYDTQGGYMPMTRQRARPGYLGLINWRI